jgi:hypothetical protein
MTRHLIIKLVVVALAIASLGLAATASAEEPVPGGAAPATPAPAQPATPAQPAEPAPVDKGVEEAPDQGLDQAKKSKDDELFERFQKECPNGEFSPGQFCKDFARGKFNTKPPTDQEKERFKRFCTSKTSEPSHNDKAFCDMYRNGDFGCDEFVTAPKCKNGKVPGKGAGNGGHYGEKDNGYDNGDYDSPVKKAEKVLNKQLPFTGLEIWQLGLLGLVLSGGGIGVRRLLAS